MVKTKVVRKISMKGKNNITIHSDTLEEEITEEEYKKVYNSKKNLLSNLKVILKQKKTELQEILALEELEKLLLEYPDADRLKKYAKTQTEKLPKKGLVISDIKKIEIEIKQEEGEIEDFVPLINQLDKK